MVRPPPHRLAPLRRTLASFAVSMAAHAVLLLMLAWLLGPPARLGPRRVRRPPPRIDIELARLEPPPPLPEEVEPPPDVQPVEPDLEPELVERELEPEPAFDPDPEPVPPSLLPLLEPVEALAALPDRFERPPPPEPEVEPPAEPDVAPEEPELPPEPPGDEGDADPLVEHAPPPPYPRAALRLRLAGTVLLRIRVSAEGDVLGATVERSSGYRLLDEAAVAGVRSWTFHPGTLDGRPAERDVLAPVTFRIP